jgi:hypothetical protein
VSLRLLGKKAQGEMRELKCKQKMPLTLESPRETEPGLGQKATWPSQQGLCSQATWPSACCLPPQLSRCPGIRESSRPGLGVLLSCLSGAAHLCVESSIQSSQVMGVGRGGEEGDRAEGSLDTCSPCRCPLAKGADEWNGSLPALSSPYLPKPSFPQSPCPPGSSKCPPHCS